MRPGRAASCFLLLAFLLLGAVYRSATSLGSSRHRCRHSSKSGSCGTSTAGTSTILQRAHTWVTTVLGRTGVGNSPPFALSTPARPGCVALQQFSTTSLVTAERWEMSVRHQMSAGDGNGCGESPAVGQARAKLAPRLGGPTAAALQSSGSSPSNGTKVDFVPLCTRTTI